MSETSENIQTPSSAVAEEAQPQERNQQGEPFEISVLPLQDTTLFPITVVPLAVGRSRSVAAVEASLATEEKLLCCISVRTEGMTGSDAAPSDLYEVGTLVMIKRMMRDADNDMHLIGQSTERVRFLNWTQEQPFFWRARVRIRCPHRERIPSVVKLKRTAGADPAGPGRSFPVRRKCAWP